MSAGTITLTLAPSIAATTVQAQSDAPAPIVVTPEIAGFAVGVGSEPLPLTVQAFMQGVPGPNTIGGYSISVAQLGGGDHLEFSGSAWVNVAKTTLSDGGNF